MGHTYNEIANKVKLGYGTIEYICTKWAPSNPDSVKKARAAALEALAGKLNEKALLALDHITPDSMTHDRIEVHDDAGKLVAVNHSGPTGYQNATVAGIMVDKAEKVQQRAALMRGEVPDTLGPGSLNALLESIQGRMTRLTKVNADIDTGAIEAHIIELKEKVENEYAEIEVQVVEDE